MPDTAWKQFERRIAKLFGCLRNPLSGINSGHKTGSDTLDPEFYVECKLRAKHAAYELWKDTAEKAKKENKIPIVALQQKFAKGAVFVIHQDDLFGLIDKLRDRS